MEYLMRFAVSHTLLVRRTVALLKDAAIPKHGMALLSVPLNGSPPKRPDKTQ
jgi:hypothetical protein